MSDTQLYVVIGIPAMFFAVNLLAILWQARGLERSFNSRFEAMQSVMVAKFDAVNSRFDVVDAKFEAARQALLRVAGVLDARLKHMEDR